MLLSYVFDRIGKMLISPQFYVIYFLPFLCNGVPSPNLRHDENKKDLIELSMPVQRKSENTSTFIIIIFDGISEI